MKEFREFIFSLYIRDVDGRWEIYDATNNWNGDGVRILKIRRPFMFAYNFRYGEPIPKSWCYVRQRKHRRGACPYEDAEEAVNAYHDKLAMEKEVGNATTTKRRGL